MSEMSLNREWIERQIRNLRNLIETREEALQPRRARDEVDLALFVHVLAQDKAAREAEWAYQIAVRIGDEQLSVAMKDLRTTLLPAPEQDGGA